MATQARRIGFLETETGREIIQHLEKMMGDAAFNTPTSYSANSEEYPDNVMPFLDKHVNYLVTHPKIDPAMYIANLRLMTRARR